jgi:hypothetical protein
VWTIGLGRVTKLSKTEPFAAASARESRKSRAVKTSYRALTEIGFLLHEIGSLISRIFKSGWTFAQERRLNTKRRRIWQNIGAELQREAPFGAVSALVENCNRHSQEVDRRRELLLHHTAFWRRLQVRARIWAAKSAYKRALQELGHSGTSLASAANQGAIHELETAMAQRRRCREELWASWRVLSFPKKMKIAGAAAVLLVSLAFISEHIFKRRFQRETSLQSDQFNAYDRTAADTNIKTNTDFSKEFRQQRKLATPRQWLVYGGNPVLERGEVRQWDDFKVGSPVVAKEGDYFRMWYRACHFLLHEYTCGVGEASSKDGMSWSKSPSPVFSPVDPHERERLDSITVVKAKDSYLMWYSVRPDRFNGYPYATVHLITSKDGNNWRPLGSVLRALSQFTPNLEPTAYFDGAFFHMWYTDYPTDEEAAIMHVTSQDGKQWQTMGSTPLKGLKTQPGKLSVLADGRGGYRAFFTYPLNDQRNAGVFGILLSTDGTVWTHAGTESKLARADVAVAGEIARTPSVLPADDGLWVWFTLLPQNGAEAIGLAFLKGAA